MSTPRRAGAGIPLEFMTSLETCDGCGLCVTSCRTALELPPGQTPGIQVVTIGDRYIPVVCHNCEDAPCVTACMPGCRHRDEETGRIVTEYDRCVGCWMCVMLCPFGAIQRIPTAPGEHHGVALKCDSCLDKEVLPCVAVCQTGGLKEVDPLEISRRKRAETAAGFADFGGDQD